MDGRRFLRLALSLHDIRLARLHARAADERILGLRAVDRPFHLVRKRLVGRARVANRIQDGELRRQSLVGVVGVPGGIGANFRWLTPAIGVTVVEHATQRKSVNQIAPVLILRQLPEHPAGRLQLAWGDMRLPTNHQHDVFAGGVVERLPRRGVDGLGKIDTGDDGADWPHKPGSAW
jgi:hypothetical protein